MYLRSMENICVTWFVLYFFFHRLFVDIFILESNQSFIHLILRMTVHRPGAEKLRLVYA